MSSTTISLRIISHNVNRKYDLLSDELELFREHFDILFVQEPPWRLICKTVSASDKEGEPVVGPPTHPDWIILFRRPGPVEYSATNTSDYIMNHTMLIPYLVRSQW